MLLDIWDRDKFDSVTTRGHGIIDGFLILTGIGYFAVVIFMEILDWV